MKKILVADDDRDIVDALVFALEQEGYTCLVAANGIDALNKCRAEKPDCVILDLKMPKMDGYKVCRLLKYDQEYARIPVIMLTARAQERDRVLGLETGADEYMTKPFELDDLLKAVRSYVDAREEKTQSQADPGTPAKTDESRRCLHTVSAEGGR